MIRKKAMPFFLCLFFACALISGCASFKKTTKSIQWPLSNIDAMQALCDINIARPDLQYEGEMSLRVQYPHTLLVEVYGPFGNTILSIEKNKDVFSLKTDSGVTTDEKRFYNLFHMTTEDLIKDLTMRGIKQRSADGVEFIEREGYRVQYYLTDTDSRMCWIGHDGKMCIKFLEIRFN
jgi:hypothetical protein